MKKDSSQGGGVRTPCTLPLNPSLTSTCNFSCNTSPYWLDRAQEGDLGLQVTASK